LKRKLLIGGLAALLVGGVALIVFASPLADERRFHLSFIGFTNKTLGPHAIYLLQAPDGVRRGDYYAASWMLREVSFKGQGDWKSWIPWNRAPHPYEFTLYEVDSNLFATVSLAQTNTASRVVFEVQAELGGISESLRRLRVRLTEKHPARKKHLLKYPGTRVYYLTNEIPAVL
jgi:hypothetical protein